MAMAQKDLILVPGSTTFDIPQFTAVHKLKKNECIQSESFKLGDYDWVIQFYPKGTSESTSDHSMIFIKVLNAKEKCSVICTPLRWDWTNSTWDRGVPETLIGLKQSGDTACSGFNYRTEPYLKRSKCHRSSKFLKDDMIRIKFDLLVTPNLSGAGCSFDNGFHTAGYAPPNGPNNTKLPRQPTVRIYCEANKDLSLTIRNGTVMLAHANSNDYYQHWIKDMTYGDKIKDTSGLPAFALVNSVTGEALKNPDGENQEVSLAPYNPNRLLDLVKWTEVESTGFHAIRIADTTSLNLTVIGSDNDTNISDGTKIVVKYREENKAVQNWKIVPYNSNVPY